MSDFPCNFSQAATVLKRDSSISCQEYNLNTENVIDIVTGGRCIVIMCLCVCCRSLAVGTKTGYKLFSLTMVEKLDCIHESGQYVALLLWVLRQCGLNICLHLVNNYISVKRLCNANFPRQSGLLYNMVHSSCCCGT